MNATAPARDPALEMERACRRPWEGYLPPIRMAKGVYYISGNDWVGCYLLDSGDGLIVIDTAMHETLYLMLENIRRLGYDPRQIRKILISHAHIDHVGGARSLKELTGASLYMGKRDMLFLKERPELLCNEDGWYTCGDFDPDFFYSDDEPIRLGNLEITTVATPGHTPGCTSFFFDVTDVDGEVRRCGMHGGVGLNTMTREYFASTGLPISLRDEYIASMELVDRLSVDIALPSHTNQVGILALVDTITDSFNPYVEPGIWHEFVRDRIDRVKALIHREEADSRLL
jgi:metallo-beta-lactamase class B